MEKLDEALINLRQNMDDDKSRSAFYDLFLNYTFFVPILDDRKPEGEAAAVEGAREVLPLITEAEGKDYLMLFSSLEHLKAWDKDVADIRFIEVPGHLLARTTTGALHWAMNAGTDFSKQFHPDEIKWLRAAVEKCDAEAAARESEA